MKHALMTLLALSVVCGGLAQAGAPEQKKGTAKSAVPLYTGPAVSGKLLHSSDQKGSKGGKGTARSAKPGKPAGGTRSMSPGMVPKPAPHVVPGKGRPATSMPGVRTMPRPGSASGGKGGRTLAPPAPGGHHAGQRGQGRAASPAERMKGGGRKREGIGLVPPGTRRQGGYNPDFRSRTRSGDDKMGIAPTPGFGRRATPSDMSPHSVAPDSAEGGGTSWGSGFGLAPRGQNGGGALGPGFGGSRDGQDPGMGRGPLQGLGPRFSESEREGIMRAFEGMGDNGTAQGGGFIKKPDMGMKPETKNPQGSVGGGFASGNTITPAGPTPGGGGGEAKKPPMKPGGGRKDGREPLHTQYVGPGDGTQGSSDGPYKKTPTKGGDLKTGGFAAGGSGSGTIHNGPSGSGSGGDRKGGDQGDRKGDYKGGSDNPPKDDNPPKNEDKGSGSSSETKDDIKDEPKDGGSDDQQKEPVKKEGETKTGMVGRDGGDQCNERTGGTGSCGAQGSEEDAERKRNKLSGGGATDGNPEATPGGTDCGLVPGSARCTGGSRGVGQATNPGRLREEGFSTNDGGPAFNPDWAINPGGP